MILLELFCSFFYVGLFSFGGGLAALPLIQHQVVELTHWMTLAEFTDLVTIAQMTPGPIAINAATFVGIRMAGIAGAVVATIGCVLPCSLIVLVLAKMYSRFSTSRGMQGALAGLRPAVVALIASAGADILLGSLLGTTSLFSGALSPDFIACGLFLAAFFLLRKKKLGPTPAMLLCGAVGGALYMLAPRLGLVV